MALALSLLLGFDAHAETWGAALNPGGHAPLGAFKAFYINTQNPGQVIASETVPAIAINYAWSEFHGIKSEDFGAYWVGRVAFSEEKLQVFEVSQSWSNTRILVDGTVVYEGGSDVRKPFVFKKGRHLVEVEYTNNWHTTSFRVAISDASLAPAGNSQILQQLQAGKLADAEIHYVGLYESKAKDLSVFLNVAQSSKPQILVLSSYDSINWIVSGPGRGDVRAIIYAAHKPGSVVAGVDANKVLVIASSESLGSYDRNPTRCTCVDAVNRCQISGELLTAIERTTGSHLVSFSTAYSTELVSVPGEVVAEGASCGQ